MTHLPNLNDIICALGTVSGTSAIAVVRVSGDGCFDLAQKLFKRKIPQNQFQEKHSIFYKTLWREDGSFLDQAMVLFYKGPYSYTGQDMVEFSVHGSPKIIEDLLTQLKQYGARLATAGEFTLRAFWNGKITLEQAEGIGEFIQAQYAAEQKLASGLMRGELKKVIDQMADQIQEILSYVELSLDFSDEDVPILNVEHLQQKMNEVLETIKKLIFQYQMAKRRKGKLTIALTGPVNAGKSSLLNQLLLEERAIVSEVPGTTRDFIDGELHFEGKAVRVIDTAGLRKASSKIEIEGIKRSQDIIQQADLVLFLVSLDHVIFQDKKEIKFTQKSTEKQYQKLLEKHREKVWLVLNKMDKLDKSILPKIRKYDNILIISAKYGTNLDLLRKRLSRWVNEQSVYGHFELSFLVNERHYHHLVRAQNALKRGLKLLPFGSSSAEFLAYELRSVLEDLGEMVGRNVKEAVLHQIFRNFCIGK